MGIGGGTGVGGSAQQPQIRESETTAFTETMKKNVLAMLPADTVEVVPFSQRTYDELFKYRSEPGKPSLHPLLGLRSAGVSKEVKEEGWQENYESLLQHLPTDIKQQLEQENLKLVKERDPDFSELNALLVLVAKMEVWLEAALQPPAANSGAEKDLMHNIALPYIALRGADAQSGEIFKSIETALQAIGPNDPRFEGVNHVLTEVQGDLKALHAQRGQLEQGEESPQLKQRMSDLASDLTRLSGQFEASGGGDFQLIGHTLRALAQVASAWASHYGSASLYLSVDQGASKLSSAESGLGVLGSSANALLEALVGGLLEAIPSGGGAQLEEMEQLHQELAQLKEGG